MPPSVRQQETLTPMKYGKNGFKYRPQYAVIIRCADETEQRDTYERLRAEGYSLKVVNV